MSYGKWDIVVTASQGLCQSLSDLVQPSEKTKAHFVSALTHPGNHHEPQRAAIMRHHIVSHRHATTCFRISEAIRAKHVL